jgi:hypothetical protein
MHSLNILNTHILNEPVKELRILSYQGASEICNLPHHLCIVHLEIIKNIMPSL